MEADMMKLSPEDHMEVLTLLMQMEKLPEFIGTHQEDNNHNPALLSSKSLQHHDASTTPLFPHPNSHSPFLDMDSPILYSGDPLSPVPPLQNNNNSSATEAMFSCNNGRRNSMAEMREMIFRIAAMQPIHIDPESIKPPKRRNVRISKDPQSVAARHRRERISERIRILQRLVPGGTKMDTASMLDEAIHYVKFLKKQVQTLEQAAINNNNRPVIDLGYPAAMAGGVNGHSPINNCV